MRHVRLELGPVAGAQQARRLAADGQLDGAAVDGQVLESTGRVRFESLVNAGRELNPGRVANLIDEKLLMRRAGGRLAVTPEGALLLDALVADLAA